MQLNDYLPQLEEQGIRVFAISIDSPEQHREAAAQFGLDYEFLSDTDYEVGTSFGFISLSQGSIQRGFIAVNPENGTMHREVDYLVADHVEDVIAVLEDL